MHRSSRWLLALVCVLVTPALAHEIEQHQPIVIDTDMGLDDAVTLALVLQCPGVQITAVVACEGAASGERATDYLERMLHLFNRADIPLYTPAPCSAARTPPPFRDFAEQSVGAALAILAEPCRQPFSPSAYVLDEDKTIVLALGPLTNLAAALRAEPQIAGSIARVIVAGSPEADENWNLRFDPDALSTVKDAGIPLEFVVPGETARKPDAWRIGELLIGQGTAIGEEFVQRLLAPPRVRQHYTEQLSTFHDELVFLYYVDPTLFWGRGKENVLVPNSQKRVVNLLTRLLADGRQGKHRVVFIDGTLPAAILQKDVRERKTRIVANNGETEWFAQLMMNELHQHLGAYSVLGAKMGLRAAELLNAPQHGMKIVSHVPARPPFSCLNDGLIISTGCTPGRLLFRHVPSASERVAVSFEYNGRRITLGLKAECRQKLSSAFATLLSEPEREDHAYWHGVRQLGLEIWENWHRRDLFEVIDAPAAPD
jgi:inosine-uridine nucleoside N-ribohydrolase